MKKKAHEDASDMSEEHRWSLEQRVKKYPDPTHGRRITLVFIGPERSLRIGAQLPDGSFIMPDAVPGELYEVYERDLPRMQSDHPGFFALPDSKEAVAATKALAAKKGTN